MAKAQWNLQRFIQINLYKNWDRVQDCISRLHALQQLQVSQAQILKESEDPQSLNMTYRKQNISCSLVNVCDGASRCFANLDAKRRKLQTLERFHLTACSVINVITQDIIKDCELLEMK